MYLKCKFFVFNFDNLGMMEDNWKVFELVLKIVDVIF